MTNATGDFELSAMQSPMVRGAEDDEVVVVVRAAVGAGFDVVHVDERGVATTGNRATPMVAAHDFATKRWGNRLGRTRQFTHVGRPHVRLIGWIVRPHVGLIGRIVHNDASPVDSVARATVRLISVVLRARVSRLRRYPVGLVLLVQGRLRPPPTVFERDAPTLVVGELHARAFEVTVSSWPLELDVAARSWPSVRRSTCLLALA